MIYESDHEAGYGSISRLNTDSNAYLHPSTHGHSFEDVVCDDCTMRMIKEGDVTSESTKLLSGENDAVNNNNNANRQGNKALLYIEVQHDNSDEENERLGMEAVEVEPV